MVDISQFAAPTVSLNQVSINANDIVDSLKKDQDQLGALLQNTVSNGGAIQGAITAAAKATADQNNMRAEVIGKQQNQLTAVMTAAGANPEDSGYLLGHMAEEYKNGMMQHLRDLDSYKNLVSASPFTDPLGWLQGMLTAPSEAARINTNAAKLDMEKKFIEDTAKMGQAAQQSINLAIHTDAKTEAELQNKIVMAKAMEESAKAAQSSNAATAAILRQKTAGTIDQFHAVTLLNNELMNQQLRPFQVQSEAANNLLMQQKFSEAQAKSFAAVAIGATPDKLNRAKASGLPNIENVGMALLSRQQQIEALKVEDAKKGITRDPVDYESAVPPILYGQTPLDTFGNLQFIIQNSSDPGVVKPLLDRYNTLSIVYQQARTKVDNDLLKVAADEQAAGKPGAPPAPARLQEMVDMTMQSMLQEMKDPTSNVYSGGKFAVSNQAIAEGLRHIQNIDSSPLISSYMSLMSAPGINFNPQQIIQLASTMADKYEKLPAGQLQKDLSVLINTYKSRRDLVDPTSLFSPYGTGGVLVKDLWGVNKGRSVDLTNPAVLQNILIRTAAARQTAVDIENASKILLQYDPHARSFDAFLKILDSGFNKKGSVISDTKE